MAKKPKTKDLEYSAFIEGRTAPKSKTAPTTQSKPKRARKAKQTAPKPDQTKTSVAQADQIEIPTTEQARRTHHDNEVDSESTPPHDRLKLNETLEIVAGMLLEAMPNKSRKEHIKALQIFLKVNAEPKPTGNRLKDMPEFLTADQVIDLFQISRRTFMSWMKQGKFEGAFRKGRHWRIPAKSLERFTA